MTSRITNSSDSLNAISENSSAIFVVRSVIKPHTVLSGWGINTIVLMRETSSYQTVHGARANLEN